jgi:alpha-ketoglutarate-dependent taurine dioxygenase
MENLVINPVMQLPVEIQLNELSPESFIAYYKEQKEALEKTLHQSGAIKFKGVHIGSTDDFQHIVDAISEKFLSYIDGNSPRTKLSGNVYTSTEYDPALRITMHNELSYSAKWPGKIFFSCLIPAATGGETLIADSRAILAAMDPDIVRAVEQHGVLYIRNLHSGEGMGPTWQDTFETTDKATVEQYCKAYGINYEWGYKDSLKLKQHSKGIITHRMTGERLWFNQIDQFHPTHLGDDMYETLELIYESPENFPMYVSFGDGAAIPPATIKQILTTIESVTLAPLWAQNELLILDNELVTHGRNSFAGDRRVLVAMSE